jgi:hypothetical protein
VGDVIRTWQTFHASAHVRGMLRLSGSVSSRKSVRGMQAVYGPNSSQLEWSYCRVESA